MPLGKSELRLQVLSRRRSLSAAEQATTAHQMWTALQPLCTGPVAAYASVGTEPATDPLLAAAGQVLLPILLPDGDLDWAAYEGELVPGPHGLRQPPGPRLGRDAIRDCSLVVVPALAVARDGTRLGRGGGSYDRALRRATGLVVAALHRGELVDELPAEPHDRPVDAVVVPGSGLVRLPPPPARPALGEAENMAP